MSPGEAWLAPRQALPGILLCIVLTLTACSPFICSLSAREPTMWQIHL